MKDYKLQKIRTDRLLVLAKWLKENEVHHKDIQYTDSGKFFTKTDLKKFKILLRAVIVLPLVFPSEWNHNNNGNVIYIHDECELTATSLIKFFDINPTIVSHLFIANKQKNEFGGKKLNNWSSTSDVADNIIEFVEKCNELDPIKNLRAQKFRLN